jgi:hypothetical protein
VRTPSLALYDELNTNTDNDTEHTDDHNA